MDYEGDSINVAYAKHFDKYLKSRDQKFGNLEKCLLGSLGLSSIELQFLDFIY